MNNNAAIIILFILIIIILYMIYYPNKKSEGLKILDTPKDLQEIINAVRTNKDIDLRYLNNVLEVNPIEKNILVEAGCTIENICTELEKYNLALVTFPENLNTTISDAVSFANHGSNILSGTCSDMVSEMVVVLPDGNTKKIERVDTEYPAFSTSLGKLGVLYTLKLDCVDLYNLSEEVETTTLSNFSRDYTDIIQEYPYSSFVITLGFLGEPAVKMYLRKPVENFGQTYYRHFTPMEAAFPGKETYETPIPFDKIIDAISEVVTQNKPSEMNARGILQNLGIQFTGPDNNSWMSGSSGKATGYITTDNPKVKKILGKYANRPSDLVNEYFSNICQVYTK